MVMRMCMVAMGFGYAILKAREWLNFKLPTTSVSVRCYNIKLTTREE